MKTKHILTALALPAMFAACTADDIVSVENGLQQAERAKLSKDFVLNTNNEVESRYAVEGSADLKFTFAKGDKIGAAIVDEFLGYTATDTYDPEDPTTWNIKYVLAGNNPFAYDGVSSWTSESELGVGNYIFTYPYNAKDNNRGAVKWELPRVQQYDANDPNAIIEANNKSISAAVLYEGQTEASVSLKNLYTYPKFNLVFDNGEDITKITKVVLKYENAIMYKGGFDHKKVVALFGNDYEKYAALATNEDELWGVKAGEVYNEKKHTLNWDAVQTSDLILANDGNSYAQFDVTNFLIVEMDQKVSKVANTDNKTASVRLMMPSVADFTTESNITMYVVTDNGTYAQELNADACAFKATTSDDAKKQALWRNKSYTLTINGGWNPEGIEDLGNIVTTAADWNKLVDLYGNAEKFNGEGTNGTLPISILSEDFALTKDLKMPKVAVFDIATSVSVKGEVTLKNIIADEVVVEKGATLTTSATFDAPVVEVEEGANLVFAAAYDEDDKLVAYEGVDKVINKGVVTVPAGVEATFELENEGTLNVGEAASRAAAEAVANITTGTNDGIINNNGTLTVTTSFTNNAPTEAKGYEYDEDGIWASAPTVNNNGTFQSKGATTNYGLFVNAKKLTSNFTSGSAFANGAAVAPATAEPAYVATLDIKAGAFTFIDNNHATIVLAEHTPANFTIYGTGAKGTIKHTATAKEVDLSASPVNYLIATGDVTLKKTYVTPESDPAEVNALETLEMIAGGKITVTATTAKLTNLILTEGKSAIDNDFTITSVAITEDAELTIPKGKKLTVEGTSLTGWLTAEGTLYIDGTLNVPGYEYANGGNVKNILAGLISANELNIELGKESTVTADEGDAAYVNSKLDNAVITWYDAAKNQNLLGTVYFTMNPYDVDAFAKFLYDAIEESWKEASVANALVGKDGWNLVDTELETIKEKLISIYSAEGGFAEAVTRNIVGKKPEGDDLKALKETYINKYGNLIASVTTVNDLFYTKDMAIRDLATKLAGATAATFESKKEIYTIISELATALNNSEGTKYAYIWAETTCPLYDVASVAKKYSPNDWDMKWDVDVFAEAVTQFNTLDLVQTWVKYADMKGATAEATVAANYVETAPTWAYTPEQVSAAFGAEKVVIGAVIH